MLSCCPAVRFLLVALLSPVTIISAQTLCDRRSHNVTSIEQLSRLRGCRVVQTLRFSSGALNGTRDISLDGIEEAKEISIGGRGCGEVPCTAPTPETELRFHSTTLRRAGGLNVYFGADHLVELSLPNLESVDEGVTISSRSLRTFNVKGLRRLGALSIYAPELSNLTIDGLQGFNPGRDGDNNSVHIDRTALTSLDNLFGRPMDASARQPGVKSVVSIHTNSLPNVRRINFAWNNLDTLRVDGTDPGVTVVFQGSDSGDDGLKYGQVLLCSGDAGVERGSSLKGTLEAERMDVRNNRTHLNVPFDKLKTLHVPFYSLDDAIESVAMTSPVALSGASGLVNITLRSNGFDLPSEFKDGKRIWRWPNTTMQRADVQGNVHMDFMKSFLEDRNPDDNTNATSRPSVTLSFALIGDPWTDYPLSCTPFERLRAQGVLPQADSDHLGSEYKPYFRCYDEKNRRSDAVTRRVGWKTWLAVALAVVATGLV
ncbi:hypothetical protein PpBr36_04869 [Pyricularia pennisetigena]|uniref:hypothetical protein n=1 Tax=Pyricularia pennisetigena TaxID=1578925 RepID=UPI001154C5CB|nr:hypothetical protein PpBr36_04869 [Pyricularia pennisetigena]TLS26884.1 hypothetical protein PpBr36_04869 [Pyricularia pennisetigena]